MDVYIRVPTEERKHFEPVSTRGDCYIGQATHQYKYHQYGKPQYEFLFVPEEVYKAVIDRVANG